MDTKAAEVLMVIFGLFLIADSFIFHLITFNYMALGLGWLDPLFNHWILGVVLVIVGVYLYRR